MPVLKNSRHERFAQLLAQGKTATDAYEIAGYKRSHSNGPALAKTEEISARVAEMNAEAIGRERATAAASISEESLRQRLTARIIARAKLPLAEERAELEDSLLSFVGGAWSSFDPSTYQPNWAGDALCEHLQAVTEGQIKRLLVNYPP